MPVLRTRAPVLQPAAHARLAAAVIGAVVVDAVQHPHPVRRQQARTWLLTTSPGLVFWSAVAGLPVLTVQRLAARVITEEAVAGHTAEADLQLSRQVVANSI